MEIFKDNIQFYKQLIKYIITMKYGLMKYGYTTNLGNEIQSIAARQYLPTIDYYIDHEKLHLFENSQNVKMIMNGWYFDCVESWPPSDSIEPLLISMHFNISANNTKEVISTPESKDYFSIHGPVGCRDISTLNLLNELDIDAYYSGDLTLTLNSQNNENEYKYIVVNADNSNEIVNFLKTKTNLDIYTIQQESIESFDLKYLNRTPQYFFKSSLNDNIDKFFMAENFLRIYDNAYCVITDRVHCALPCLALKTPVLFINTRGWGPERLLGLDKLLNHTDFESYKERYAIFDVENPPENPKNYLKIREKLIGTVKEFTGHYNESKTFIFSENYVKNYQTELLSKTSLETRNYMRQILKQTKNYNNQISELKNDLETLKQNSLKKDELIINQNKLINKYKTLNSDLQKEIDNLRRKLNES